MVGWLVWWGGWDALLTLRKGYSLYSLNRMAPVLSTKKKVPIMEAMMVVKLATMTICVTVTWRHQGTGSCIRGRARVGGGALGAGACC